jgi:hypothetical protein
VQARKHIIELDPNNARMMDIIEKAVFCVALERTNADTLDERSHNALLGTGLNRWYDKPFTMIVYPNGMTALNGEHTWADAMVIVKQQDYVMKSVAMELKASGPPKFSKVSATYKAPELLDFKLDSTALQAIELASSNISRLISTIDLSILQFRHFGRNFIKRYVVGTTILASHSYGAVTRTTAQVLIHSRFLRANGFAARSLACA